MLTRRRTLPRDLNTSPPPRSSAAVADRLPWSWLAAIAVTQLILAAALAPHVMGEGDAAEFTLVLAVGGVPHPTGYPLYSLLGHAFVRVLHALGFGWPLAANLWSVAGATVATLLAAALIDRILPTDARLGRGARLAIVVAAVLALVTNPVFLRAATQAEVYGWHTAWVAGSMLAGLCLYRRLTGATPISRQRTCVLAFGWGLLAGAGLSHHLTSVFFVVPLTLLLAIGASRASRLEPVTMTAALAGLAFPLLSYAFVAWRAFHPAPFQWPALEPTARSVLAHASGSVYRVYLGGFRPSESESRLLLWNVAPVVLPGLAAALLAALHDGREADGPPLAALLAAGALQLAFTLVYGISDPSASMLPVMLVAVAALARAVARELSRRTRSLALAIIVLAAVASLGTACTVSEFEHVRRIEQVDRDLRQAFRTIPFRRGIVVWNSDSYVRLRAYQLLDGDQPGLIVLNPTTLTWDPARRAETRALGFDPLAGLRLESDADLDGVAANIARQTRLPVVDFASWWDRFGALHSSVVSPG